MACKSRDFAFRVTCVFGISMFTVNDDANNDVKIAKKPGDPVTSDDLYANPMHLTTPISSVLTVMVTRKTLWQVPLLFWTCTSTCTSSKPCQNLSGASTIS